MSDLSSMIDDTTERLLRKIDNWEVPKSDKEYVTIEKEVWESTLRVSMERAGKIETLQKQLETQRKEHCIAIDGLRTCLLNCRNYFTSNNLEYFVNQIDKTLDIYRS